VNDQPKPMPERPTFHEIYMELAKLMSRRSTCSRLQVGCAIVSQDFRHVLAVGYNGGASGQSNDCTPCGTCSGTKHYNVDVFNPATSLFERTLKECPTCHGTGSPPGQCGHLHAEDNACINCHAPRSEPKIVFTTDLPCDQCAKRLVNLGGVVRLVYDRPYRLTAGLDVLRDAGIMAAQYLSDLEISWRS